MKKTEFDVGEFRDKLYVAHNPNKPLMAYDLPHIFTKYQMKEANERVEYLNSRAKSYTNKKGWVLYELED